MDVVHYGDCRSRHLNQKASSHMWPFFQPFWWSLIPNRAILEYWIFKYHWFSNTEYSNITDSPIPNLHWHFHMFQKLLGHHLQKSSWKYICFSLKALCSMAAALFSLGSEDVQIPKGLSATWSKAGIWRLCLLSSQASNLQRWISWLQLLEHCLASVP